MKRDDIIAKLRAHEPELRAAGVRSLALVGSAARSEQRIDSDIDIVVRLAGEAAGGGLDYFARLDAVNRRLEAVLERPLQPIRKDRLRRGTEKDRIIAF
jgi:predicted nucleotidyltransferase